MTPTPVATSRLVPPDAVATMLVGHAADAPSLFNALGELLRERPALAAWLRSFDDDERAAECAARSYWHPNGFAKLVLHATPEFRIRVHVWPEGTDRLGENNPHSHRWDFASVVLCGDGLVNTEYVESPDGAPFLRYRYTGGRIDAPLMPQGTAVLRTTDIWTITSHERYSVSTDVVHTVEPLGASLVATLLLQGPPKVASTVVYCGPGQDADQQGIPISADDVRKLVRDVVNAPDGPGRQP